METDVEILQVLDKKVVFISGKEASRGLLLLELLLLFSEQM